MIEFVGLSCALVGANKVRRGSLRFELEHYLLECCRNELAASTTRVHPSFGKMNVLSSFSCACFTFYLVVVFLYSVVI